MGAAWIDPDGRELGATDGMADGAAQAVADDWLSARAGSSPTALVLVGLLRARIGTAADASALLDDAAMAVRHALLVPASAPVACGARCDRTTTSFHSAQGNASAQFFAAALRPPDCASRVAWLHAAAAAGVVRAMTALGEAYYLGVLAASQSPNMCMYVDVCTHTERE